jgi:hypothetical protein
MYKILRTVAIVALIASSSGCYHHHLRANGDRVNSTYFSKTLDTSSGNRRSEFIVPPRDSGAQGAAGLRSSADCKANGLYEVGIASYWKYAAGTVFSFGRWSRVKVEWLCAKEPPVIGPRGLGSQPPAAAARQTGTDAAGVEQKPRHVNTNRDDFTKRTVHAFFWGALQQNLYPPAPHATSTPANCKSMRQVKVPMNYGYALITVATVGIWSPLRVAWQCAEGPNGGSTPPAPAFFGAMPPVPALPHWLLTATAGSYSPSSKEENHVPR